MTRHQAPLTIVLGLAAFAPSAAFPCGNAVMLETNEAAKLVARAEADLQEGRYQRALSRLHHGDVEVNSQPLQKRIDLVTSTAMLRLGQVTNAAWAFDALSQRHPDDALIATRLAETLSRLGTQAGDTKALSILESLEKRDLVADEHGFLALAKLRDRSGDTEGRDRALTRCRAVAKEASFCSVETKSRSKTKSTPKAVRTYGDGPTS